MSTNYHPNTGNNLHNKNIKNHITTNISSLNRSSSLNIPTNSSFHPFEVAISQDHHRYFHSTSKAATSNPHSKIVTTNGTVSPHVSNKSFADLIKYNSPIDDSIIFTYLTILGKHYPDIYQLDSNFHWDLRTHGWIYAYTAYFYNEQ